MKQVDRLEATQELRKHLTNELVVGAITNPSYDLFLAGDRPENFYTWGAMGTACSIGLGVAISVPTRKVIVLDGDGSILMNLSALATVGVMQPANLVHIVWNNRSYDITGGQKTATAAGVDLAAVARGCGIPHVEKIDTLEEFTALIPKILQGTDGPWFVDVETGPTSPDRKKPLIPLRRRFMELEPFIESAWKG